PPERTAAHTLSLHDALPISTIRTAEYWLEQLFWLHEDRSNFLVAHDNVTGAVVGYVRGQTMPHTVEILELGVEEDNSDIGRTLLDRKSTRLNSSHRTSSYAV